MDKENIQRNFEKKYAVESFSQEGEDLILKCIFSGKKHGFFVDIGAHHPFRFSNTYLLYKQGWNGINIDAMPNSMELFHQYRYSDINLEMGIGDNQGELDFYVFNETALNTFDNNLKDKYLQIGPYELSSVVKVKTDTLSNILEKYLPDDKKIDFFNIDVEGLDLNVLKSNNWSKFRPEFVLVEILDIKNMEDLLTNPISTFLSSVGYSIYAKTVNTVFYRRIKD
jgi:FkbM family methyltransferase